MSTYEGMATKLEEVDRFIASLHDFRVKLTGEERANAPAIAIALASEMEKLGTDLSNWVYLSAVQIPEQLRNNMRTTASLLVSFASNVRLVISNKETHV